MNPFKYGSTVDGEHFCPRPELERKLASYIEAGQNVVIQGERRTGKTSLVLETVRHMRGVALFHADFLGVRDQADFCGRLVSALGRLENSDGWLAKILRALAHLRPSVTLDPATGAPSVTLDARVALRDQDHLERAVGPKLPEKRNEWPEKVRVLVARANNHRRARSEWGSHGAHYTTNSFSQRISTGP